MLREFVEEHGRTPRADEQRGIMLRQQEREDALAMANPVVVVIGDPADIRTDVAAATKIPGQLFDWGKSNQCLKELFDDLENLLP